MSNGSERNCDEEPWVAAQVLDVPALVPTHVGMDTGRGLRCRVGWHRWHVVAEEHMEVRVCDDCGRRRFKGPLPGGDTVPPANWGMSYTGGGGFGGDGG